MESVCLAARLMVDLPERLPSLSEYLCEDLPTPQLREDDEGNLIVQLEKDQQSQSNHFLPCYEKTREQERTWTYLESKPAFPVSLCSNVTQSSHFRPEPEINDSYGFSTIDSHSVSWDQFPEQIDPFGFSSSSSSSSSSFTSLPPFPSADVTSSSHIGRDVSVASFSNKNCSVTWPKPNETTLYERTSDRVTSSSSPASGVTSSSRKRAPNPAADLDDPEARKLELKRAKNREAAQRCQQRKQERIVRLEGKVGRLREQNLALTHTVTGLREQIAWLQRQIVTHANNGCHITLPRYAPVGQHPL